MSFNRENVTWQNADGTWNMAFYLVTWEGLEDEGYDPEWDVEYDYSKFESYGYARRCATEDAAYEEATRNRPNPSGSYVVPRPGNEAECERYDAMLETAISLERERKERARQLWGRGNHD